jgi:hypothetical protein
VNVTASSGSDWIFAAAVRVAVLRCEPGERTRAKDETHLHLHLGIVSIIL